MLSYPKQMIILQNNVKIRKNHYMNRYLLYISLMASSLLAATGCSDEEHEIIPDIPTEEKTPIELSVGSMGAESATRAITVAPDDNSKLGTLPAGTALFMVMKSKKNGSGSNTKYAVTKGVTEAANESTKESPIDFSADGCTRYWDDCYARDASLSVYAACCPGSTKTITIGGKSNYPYSSMPTTGAWSSDAVILTIANWSVSANQTDATIKDEDLCYSNNIADNSPTYTDGRLKFTPSGTGTSGTFDKGNLCFYHALSWITFEIKMGDGFTSEEFKFAEGTNIQLTNFYTSNTVFDIATGDFQGAYSSSIISMLSQRAAATDGSMFTLDARVLPTTEMSTDNKGDIDLTIAGNNYKLSKKDLLDQISSDDKNNHMIEQSKLKPGVHYIFTLNISKTSVKISAKIVDWETVTAEGLIPSNARIQLQLEERGTEIAQPLAIYRAEDNPSTITDEHEGYNWTTGYVDNSNIFKNIGSSTWGLDNKWYWPNNMTYYHFRGVAPTSKSVQKTSESDAPHPNIDYFYITSEVSYTDALWGAPMRKKDASGTSYKFIYDKDNGFGVNIENAESNKSQIYQAIGPTEETVKLTLFHMMSEVKFVLTTTGESDGNKVDLGSSEGQYTTLELKNFYKDGRVLMGTGLVETTGSVTASETISNTLTSSNKECSYGVVPQDLTGVQVVITTADKNNYIVNMKDVLATTVSENNIKNPYTADNTGETIKYKIDRWYPGFKYTYTFKLTKKGIEIKATVVDWETVEASDDEVQIQ